MRLIYDPSSYIQIGRKLLVLALLSTILSSALRAQNNVSVNLPTGTANVTVPVYTVSRGQVSVPVSLDYIASGIRLGEMQSVIGTGWQLNAGGAVIRSLRDLPDDIKTDQSSNSRMGWMFNSNATKISNFTPANDNNSSTCTDETSDINYINSNFSDNSDMEPDIFYVQAPGLSCQLVFDQASGVFRTIPYVDIKVNYTLNATGNTITAFKILNANGIEYTFDVAEPITQTTSSSTPASIAYFKRAYNLFQNGIVYNNKWCLSKIKDLYGNAVVLSYTNTLTTRNLNAPTVIKTYNGTTWASSILYSTLQTYQPQFLSDIRACNTIDNTYSNQVSFNYTTTTDASGYLVSSIYLNSSARTLVCTYNKVPTLTRDYLISFGESGCSAGGVNYNTRLYKFDYTGITFAAGSDGIRNLILNGDNQDFWGYPNSNFDSEIPLIYVYPDNPSYPNLERYRYSAIPGYTGTYYTISTWSKVVDQSYISLGTISKLTYPAGGSTSFVYEPSDYYDVSAANTSLGGGIRIKQLIDYDGLNVANNIVRNYSYTDPATGVTTGKPTSMPACAFTIPYTGSATGADYWKYSTVLLTDDRSANDVTVLYGKVSVSQTGTGKTVYEYATPATFWDASAGTDWTPVVVNTGRPSSGSCPSVGSLKNDKYTYPFVPNPNYNFERGLLTKTSSYNSNNQLVSQSVYSYQRSFANATPITAFKFDDNSTAKAYAKYQLYTTTSELPSSVTNTIYDLTNTTADAARQVQTITNIYYQGASHKLPTKIEKINTDGTTNLSYIKYTKDYTFAPNDIPDQTVTTLKAFVDLNVNIPVENYTAIKRASVEKVVSGNLVKFGSFPSGIASPANIYLPAQELKFLTPDSQEDDFAASHNSGGTFHKFSGYKPTTNFLSYNYNGSLLSKDDNNKNIKSQLMNTDLLSVAAVSNARYNEVVYSNFDDIEGQYAFTQTGASVNNSVSRTGINSLSFPASGLLQASPALQDGAKNYYFSCWINAAASGSLTISLYTSGNALFGTKSVSFTASGSGWNYYEQKINTNGLTSNFTIKVQTNTTINIDDVLFYPENAEVNTYAFERKFFQKSTETNTNGVSRYYGYDGFGRLQYIYDQDKNIVAKKSYEGPNAINSGLISASFTASPSTTVAGNTITFTGSSGSGACTPGTLYSWNFGDGATTTPSLTNSSISHSYSAGGNYTVQFTAANSIYGTKTYTQNVTINMIPSACLSGVWAYFGNHAYTQTCSPNPSDATHSYFTVNSIAGIPAGASLTYQWQIYYTDTGGSGSGVWTNIAGVVGNPAQLIVNFSASTFRPYKARCIITDTNSGATGTTTEMVVQNDNS